MILVACSETVSLSSLLHQEPGQVHSSLQLGSVYRHLEAMATAAVALPTGLDLKAEFTPPQIEQCVAALEPDTLYIFEDNSVSSQNQAKLSYAGFRTIAKLRGLGNTRDEVARIMKTSLGLDGDADLNSRSEVAGIQAAWEAAKVYIERRVVLETEERLHGATRQIKGNEYNRLRTAHQQIHGKMNETVAPAITLIEKVASEIEEGELLAIHLDEAASKEEGDNDVTMQPTLTRDGLFKMSQKAKLKVGMPSDTESLRRRITILGNALGMVKLKMSNHAWLRTCTPAVFSSHLEFILGEEVYGIQAMDSEGRVVGTPSWSLVLSYEFHIREAACKLMNQERVDCASAFERARKDIELKTKFFTTPMAISVGVSDRHDRRQGGNPQNLPAKRPFENRQHEGLSQNQKRKMKKRKNEDKPRKQDNPGNRGQGSSGPPDNSAGIPGGKGNGRKGAGKKIPPGVKLHTETDDGKQICFRFNNLALCASDCNKVHCCQICFALDHPYPHCPKMNA